MFSFVRAVCRDKELVQVSNTNRNTIVASFKMVWALWWYIILPWTGRGRGRGGGGGGGGGWEGGQATIVTIIAT